MPDPAEMDSIHLLETLDNRLQELNKSKPEDLRKIKTPEDINALCAEKRGAASDRNVKILKELEMASGKLHTMKFCPVEGQLAKMKQRFYENV